MIENSSVISPLEATRPKRELGSATIALADKQGGGGVSAWITKARAEAQFRQRQQAATD